MTPPEKLIQSLVLLKELQEHELLRYRQNNESKAQTRLFLIEIVMRKIVPEKQGLVVIPCKTRCRHPWRALEKLPVFQRFYKE